MEIVCVDATTKQLVGNWVIPPAEIRRGMIVEDVMQLLSVKLQLGRGALGALKLYGQTLPEANALAPYLPALRTSNPRWVFAFERTTRVTISVFVALPSGAICVQIHPSDTIADLKNTIRVHSSCPFQRLTLHHQTLEDRRTVSSYGITNSMTIGAAVAVRGGGAVSEFVDVANDDLYGILEQSPTAPDWRRFCAGMNVHGICTSVLCAAYQQWVIMPRKFAPFNLLMHRASCPMCARPIAPRTVGFFNCLWRFEGIKHPSNMHLSSPWKVVEGDDYVVFEEDSPQVLWHSLVLSARRNLGCDECAVCCEDLSQGPTERVKPCQHQIHSACLAQWTDTCTRRSAPVNCPTCRAPI
ncbi:ubiquitin family RING domain-containing protein [Achlya hypogyna]|uniref:Ubiquitin family RING domain-containing protein n=1 Tax=Achlya hypogyna TaxID=1202772 RepID=A0A1V9Y684_ACHHY|nr:ubiquitin family RING domain-containing protein [Achlya hypogyna]